MPILAQPTDLSSLPFLANLKSINLCGCNLAEAKRRLLAGVIGKGSRPIVEPRFPGDEPAFPPDQPTRKLETSASVGRWWCGRGKGCGIRTGKWIGRAIGMPWRTASMKFPPIRFGFHGGAGRLHAGDHGPAKPPLPRQGRPRTGRQRLLPDQERLLLRRESPLDRRPVARRAAEPALHRPDFCGAERRPCA